VNAADLTDREAHLVAHVAAMGGWLSESYLFPDYTDEMYRLATCHYPPLFVPGAFDDGRTPIWRLTDAGLTLAPQLKGTR
jgi:hypothetical protein